MFVPAKVMTADVHPMGGGEIDDRIGVFPIVAVFLRVDGTHFHSIFRGQAIEFPDDQRCIRAGDRTDAYGNSDGEIVAIIGPETLRRIGGKMGSRIGGEMDSLIGGKMGGDHKDSS